MPSLFLTVLALIAAGDLLWWWWADRRLRPLPRARLWRALLGLFAGGHLALLGWVVFLRAARPDGAGPAPVFLTALVYLWHLLALPAATAALALAGTVAAARRLGRGVAGLLQVGRGGAAPAAPAAPHPPPAPTRRQPL